MARSGAAQTGGKGMRTASAVERTCVVTRAKLSPGELIRFVCSPDGVITPDIDHKLPGRGVWVRLARAAVETAIGRNAFARSLKRPVVVPEGLPGLVETLLVKRAMAALSLANKAGAVVAGFTKVEVAIGRGEVAVLVHAADASDDGARKLDGKVRAVSAAAEEAGEPIPAAQFVTNLASSELSLALGRQNVVHAAIRIGGAAKHFLTEAGRLERYREDSHGEAGRPPHGKFSTEQA